MSLSASMWTSVSGLMAHGEKMNVVGNNIANVSTIGFKSQRMDFADFLYVDKGVASGSDQVGQGVSINAILGDFSQGSFESTNTGTDIAISGNGFFKVRNQANNATYYTRAGDFYFNADYELQNPAGLVLQGWKVNNKESIRFGTGAAVIGNLNKGENAFKGYGSPTDIVMDQWNLIPQQTTHVNLSNNLVNKPEKYDKTIAGLENDPNANPMTALYDLWDGSKEPPIPETAYATQSTVSVYDEGGKQHDLTVYMDQVSTDYELTDSAGKKKGYAIADLPAGYSVYEYIVTCKPEEDSRLWDYEYDTESGQIKTGSGKSFQGTKAAGLMMTGLLIFDGAGQLVDQTAYTYQGKDDSYDPKTDKFTPKHDAKVTGDPTDTDNWFNTRYSNNGLPVLAANFSGVAGANSVTEARAEDYLIEIDFGLTNANSAWQPGKSLTEAKQRWGAVPIPDPLGGPDLGVKQIYYFYSETNGKNGFTSMTEPLRDTDATANNGTSFITDIQSNGYGSGVLSNYNIDNNGVLYGIYNNGVSIPLYQITMTDFANNQGLYREGGNLYRATSESGNARIGVAGDGVFGETRAYNIEQSNVDLAREFVQMISTQRGFQANSKSITTVDTMLETVIGMKR